MNRRQLLTAAILAPLGVKVAAAAPKSVAGINKAFFEALANSAVEKRAVDAVTAFTRSRMRSRLTRLERQMLFGAMYAVKPKGSKP